MPPPKFDNLRERLLRGGVAPRHVRRFIDELADHLDDLVREECTNGASRDVAQVEARSRLGSDSDLAVAMLACPGLRSLAARNPLAVFGLGPVVMVLAAFVFGVAVELQVLDLIDGLVSHPSDGQREALVLAIAIWNFLAAWVAPLVIAGGLCVVGLRQRTSPIWILVAIGCACVLGAFQEIDFSDDGRHGRFFIGSGLLPPFPATLILRGLCRTGVTTALALAFYGLCLRRRGPGATPWPAIAQNRTPADPQAEALGWRERGASD